jgi:hypothetical protein
MKSLTKRELLGLHADVLSLRESLGISYKDASHRLYLAEWEKIKVLENTLKSFANLTIHTENSLERFQSMMRNVTEADKEADEAEAEGSDIIE